MRGKILDACYGGTNSPGNTFVRDDSPFLILKRESGLTGSPIVYTVGNPWIPRFEPGSPLDPHRIPTWIPYFLHGRQSLDPPPTSRRPTDRPPTDRPTDRPPTDIPTVRRPADRPTTDRPTADRPTADGPIADRPIADRPTADRPNIRPPTDSRPPADRPSPRSPARRRPTYR